MRQSCPFRRAFSLTELLIVSALIAVLIGLLIPVAGAVRRRGHAMECLGHLRTLGQAVRGYQVDHRSYYPLSSHTTGNALSRDSWLQSLAPFGFTEAHRFCPDDPHATSRYTSYVTSDYFEPRQAWIDYNPVTGDPIEGGRARAYSRSIDVRSPTQVVYATESAGDGALDHLNTSGWTEAEEIADGVAVERHDGAANYLFSDGHVDLIEWLTVREQFLPDHNFFNPEYAR